MNKRVLAALGVVAVAACVPPFELVATGDRQIGSAYTINTPASWTRMADSDYEIWTVDGFVLQSLRLYGSVADGETLVEGGPSAHDKKKVPRYRSGMEAIDVADLVEATLEFNGATGVSIFDVRPARFGSRDGFRFEADFMVEGLAYRGSALGSVDEQGRLDLMLYTGTRQHYFDRHRETVEHIFASVRTS